MPGLGSGYKMVQRTLRNWIDKVARHFITGHARRNENEYHKAPTILRPDHNAWICVRRGCVEIDDSGVRMHRPAHYSRTSGQVIALGGRVSNNALGSCGMGSRSGSTGSPSTFSCRRFVHSFQYVRTSCQREAGGVSKLTKEKKVLTSRAICFLLRGLITFRSSHCPSIE